MSYSISQQQIVLATGNKGKQHELQQLFNTRFDTSAQIVAQSEFDVPEADETGLTFVENALIKARNAAAICKLPAIADDSGIEVDYLQGRPGIYSARFAGPQASDNDNIAQLLNQLEGIDIEQRSARFRCVMVFMRHELDPTPIISLGTWEGSILTHTQGSSGFGYDPLFWVASENRSAAELDVDRKNTLSHRGKALNGLIDQLQHSNILGMS